jgi:hypothetical protein
LGDGSFVLDAGESDAGGICVGLWQDGQAIAYATVDEAPKLLTPLYGYYFRSDQSTDSTPGLVAASAQPASVTTWLETFDVDRAVVVPVEVEDFPIPMSALRKAQLAIHEAFHIVVQAPRWFESIGPWPVWDQQPDRAGVRACYTHSPDVETALGLERESLVLLVNSLLNGDTTAACRAGEEFLSRRDARHELLSDATVALHDGALGSCREAEAIMELEEGTADYASWTVLYDLGQASREQLIRRYEAQQNDMFYLTGAMQLHAVQLMRPDGMGDVAREIAESEGPEDGSITSVLTRTLGSYCR